MDTLGLLGYDGFDFAVANLGRSRRFYAELMDWAEIARSGPEVVRRDGEESAVFAAGDVRVRVIASLRGNSRTARFLRRHPDGITAVAFRVADLDRAWRFLEARGATMINAPLDARAQGAAYRHVEIATPLGEVVYRFVERGDGEPFVSGLERVAAPGPGNRFGIEAIDHITSNTVTMTPVVLWYREVLGLERYWDIEFHTAEMERDGPQGSGLRSIVMWDRTSGIKLATNEPLRPAFHDSQINVFVEQNRGAGVQHIALRVPAILPAVSALAERGVEFLATPAAYYQMLPERLERLGLTGKIREPLDELQRHGILVDGKAGRYLLQIFLRDASVLYQEEQAGPFFYEIIQREGHQGFGEGNFRALFEAIEREQFLAHASPMG
jgi:4-hydroxyphenylpyruvate dioxygenase